MISLLGVYRNDFHEFQFASACWSTVRHTGSAPAPRYRTACVTINDSMVLVGGHDG